MNNKIKGIPKGLFRIIMSTRDTRGDYETVGRIDQISYDSNVKCLRCRIELESGQLKTYNCDYVKTL